jgi:hypothetical protein
MTVFDVKFGKLKYVPYSARLPETPRRNFLYSVTVRPLCFSPATRRPYEFQGLCNAVQYQSGIEDTQTVLVLCKDAHRIPSEQCSRVYPKLSGLSHNEM